MTQFGDLYSQYYDLLYQDKDYIGEVEYVDRLIKKYGDKYKKILDLGCGTGRHAEIFCNKGYTLHGVDISEEMLIIAEKARVGKEDRLTFTQSDITMLNLNEKFDVVMSLFHVMSYQIDNTNLDKVFSVVRNHVEDDGLFIFDFWYGPAVLTDLPKTTIKRLENDDVKIIRIGESCVCAQSNIVDVNFNILIQQKDCANVVEKTEKHRMRYFFDTELEMVCEKYGFSIEAKHAWLSEREPDFNSWNAVWVVKKQAR